MVYLFDVDKTVIKRTSAWYFLQEALKEKLIRFSRIRRLPVDLIKYKLARPDSDFIENTVKNLAGLEKSALEKAAEISFERRIKQNIYAGAAHLIKEAQQRGEQVLFATSSLDFIIRPLERFFGIEGSLASAMEFRDGKTTGRLVGYSFFGKKKMEAAAEWMKKNGINPQDVCFYSDSYTDIPLLEYCGSPVAVNPDRILLREAKKRSWKVVRFKELLSP